MRSELKKELLKLVGISLSLALVGLIGLYIVIPPYIASLGGNIFLIGAIYSAISVARALSKIASGLIRDRLGDKPVFLLSRVLYAIAFLILFLSSNISHVALGLLLSALAMGFELPAFMSATATIVADTAFTATLFGVILTIRSAPVVVAPVLTGFIADNYGVKAVFLTGVLLSLASFLLLCKVNIEKQKTAKEETIAGKPIWQKEFIILMISTYFLFASLAALVPIFSHWVVEKLGYSYTVLGLMLLARNITASLSRIYSGTLADRLGDLNLLALVGLSRIAALLALSCVKDPLALTIALSMHEVFVAAPPRNAYISKIISKEDYGKAFGAIGLAQELGRMTGPLLGGYVAQIYCHEAAFVVLALILVFYTALILLLKFISRSN